MEPRNEGDQVGTGEVHAHLSQPDKGYGMSGGYQQHGSSTDPSSQDDGMIGEARNRVESMVEDAQESMADTAAKVRDRAREQTSEIRERASRTMHRAEELLEERTGVMHLIRENPLPALGIAMGVGYLLAGSGSSRDSGRFSRMARSQLRGAILGGLSAALTRELRQIVEEQGGSLAEMLGFGEDNEAAGEPSSHYGSGS